MAKPKLVRFVVELELPEDATATDARDYILDAVRAYCGGLRPPNEYGVGDPMFDLDCDSIRTFFFRKPRRETVALVKYNP